MSGDFSTMNPACWTRGLRTSPTRLSWRRTCSAAVSLALKRSGLRQIEQHRSQQIALVLERHAADQVGGVLALGEPARGLVGGAALRQDVDGGAVDRAIADRIGVDGHEQIRLLRARAAHAVAQRHEVIAVAGEHRLHAGLGIHAALERARDGERHVLLARAVHADGAGILAAVTGVDGDDEIAGLGRRVLRLDGRCRLAATAPIAAAKSTTSR